MSETFGAERMRCPHYMKQTVRASRWEGRFQVAGDRQYWVCTLDTPPEARPLWLYQPKCGGCTTRCDFDAFGQAEG